MSAVLSKENVILEESENPPKTEKRGSVDSASNGSTVATLGLVRHKMQINTGWLILDLHTVTLEPALLPSYNVQYGLKFSCVHNCT